MPSSLYVNTLRSLSAAFVLSLACAFPPDAATSAADDLASRQAFSHAFAAYRERCGEGDRAGVSPPDCLYQLAASTRLLPTPEILIADRSGPRAARGTLQAYCDENGQLYYEFQGMMLRQSTLEQDLISLSVMGAVLTWGASTGVQSGAVSAAGVLGIPIEFPKTTREECIRRHGALALEMSNADARAVLRAAAEANREVQKLLAQIPDQLPVFDVQKLWASFSARVAAEVTSVLMSTDGKWGLYATSVTSANPDHRARCSAIWSSPNPPRASGIALAAAGSCEPKDDGLSCTATYSYSRRAGERMEFRIEREDCLCRAGEMLCRSLGAQDNPDILDMWQNPFM